MATDRRDRGSLGEKEWQEFRSGYAAARTFALLLDDFTYVLPNYLSELRRRLSEGISVGEGFLEENPESDGPALIPGPTGGDQTMMDLSAARLLEEQLFPERERSDPRDFNQTIRGMATVALHATLEAYATAIGATRPRTPLPLAIATFLSAGGLAHQLPSSLADTLTEFDETRHIVIHHRGVVSDRYVANVKYNTLEVSEVRCLTSRDILRYADMTWQVARALAATQNTAA